MKTRLQKPVGLGPATVTPIPARNSEAVGAASAAGDGTRAPVEAVRRYQESERRPPEPTGELPAAYDGEERRKRDRRQDARPTTLDTRDNSTDRRRGARISYKV